VGRDRPVCEGGNVGQRGGGTRRVEGSVGGYIPPTACCWGGAWASLSVLFVYLLYIFFKFICNGKAWWEIVSPAPHPQKKRMLFCLVFFLNK